MIRFVLSACLFVSLSFAARPIAAQSANAAGSPRANLHWLGEQGPAVPVGVSFGVPWTRGVVSKGQTFALTAGAGRTLPVQTWPMAYWPDGSVKWLGVATVASAESGKDLQLAPSAGATTAEGPRVRVRSSDTTFEIDTGAIQARIPMHGSSFITRLSIGGRDVAGPAQLVGVVQEGPDGDPEQTPAREKLGMRVDRVTMEQSGPVRAVVKIEGVHLGAKSQRAWLPFVVRLYFYAGQKTIRLVHTFFFDGNDQTDFIRGLGLTFAVPLREEIQNRHVRFSGADGGLWAEPIQPMIGRGGRFVADPNGKDLYPTQIAGQRVPSRTDVPARGQNLLADWAVWDDFKLVQPNADGFTIQKRTNPESVWLPAGAGKRASGLAFVGDVSGGLAVSVKNFWQSFPSSLEIRHAASGTAQLTAWLWSPDAPAMDLRHYDTKAHGLEAVYEDVQPGFSTAHGVARTSELTLYPSDAVPSREETLQQAGFGAAPPLLLATPATLKAGQAFGEQWSPEDRSTPVKTAIEDRLARTLNFYLTQPEQQRWYGFWDFGDVMHSYDDDRHTWRYDLGGMAWANSELGPDMWLWYSFLRTGRADIFRMAEAMTRHTGEVDCYHLGPFAGLGSRHNVRHWGCGAKEARISQAAYRRFYYYLTTDERVGDVMREMLNADFKTIDYDPMRLAQPITAAEKKIAPTRVRLGPDWFAFLGNWMTEWERTGNTQWRDKILAGVASLDAMPLGLRSGKNLVFGYDPATGKLYQLSDEAGTYNLATIMGGAEVVFELNLMLDDPRWHKLWLDYCRLYTAPKEVLIKNRLAPIEAADAKYVRDGRLAAYVFHVTKNEGFLTAGLDALLRTAGSPGRPLVRVQAPNVLNPVDEGLGGTNGAAQSGLETITMLGLIGDRLPAELPANLPAAARKR